MFIWNSLPAGVAGLVIAAILAAGMSNLSAALNALASTTVMDFYKPFVIRRDPAHVRRAFSRSRSLGHCGLGRRSCFWWDWSRATWDRCWRPA